MCDTLFKIGSLYFQGFSLEEERALAEYVIKCSKMFHGLSIRSTRKLAWEYASQNLKDYPDAWDQNSEAGVDWFYGLMKRNPSLSIRMPEATSIARATAFNRYNVDMFFNKYESIITRPNFKFEPKEMGFQIMGTVQFIGIFARLCSLSRKRNWYQ